MCKAGSKAKDRERRRKEHRLRGAFTLIELMVVLVVMAILAGAIAPSLVSAIRRTGAKSASTQIMDLLDFACVAAIARRQPVTVNFDLERNVCWASVRSLSLPWLTDQEGWETRTLASLQLPEDLAVSFYRGSVADLQSPSEQTWETVRFEPDGTAEDIVIELTDRNDTVRMIEVVFATGEVILTEER